MEDYKQLNVEYIQKKRINIYFTVTYVFIYCIKIHLFCYVDKEINTYNIDILQYISK